MNVVRLFPLEATTAAKDYIKGGGGWGGVEGFLRNFNLLGAKVNLAKHSYHVYNNAVHK